MVEGEFGLSVLYLIVSNRITKHGLQGEGEDAVDVVACLDQFSTAYTRRGGPHL